MIEYNEFKQKWISDTVVVSEQVGKVIDLKERNKFNLFPTINGFLSAVFLKLKDGRFILEISFFNSKYGQEVMRFLPQNEDTIKLYKMRIE